MERKSSNFFYVHSSLKENVGKLGVLLSLEVDDKNKAEFNDFGKKLTMQIAASSPLSVDRDGLDKKIIEKEKELITEELKNTGKDSKIINKIAPNWILKIFIPECRTSPSSPTRPDRSPRPARQYPSSRRR